MDKRQPLLVIVGPTAVGKTELSLMLARRYRGEIISGDSMQVYRGMDIGTAKASPRERAEIPHHLIDIKDPDEDFSVAEFQSRVHSLLEAIHTRGHFPMIVGGTGLYIQSVTHDFQFAEAGQDEAFRQQMQQIAAEKGNEALHKKLAKIDPATAERLHPNDTKRIVRALEIHHLTGRRMSEFQKRTPQTRYDLLIIGLHMERKKLYERIDRRVDQMIEQGLVEEVRRLLNAGYGEDCVSMQALGYKELIPYLRGEVPLDEAVEQIKKRTRNFAKRQLSWFRRMEEITWFDLTEPGSRDKIYGRISDYVQEKFPVNKNMNL